MSLTDWQISLISTAVGALVGTIIPFIYVFVHDKQTEERKRKQIREALCSELFLAHDTLSQILSKGKEDGNVELFIAQNPSDYGGFPLNTEFYQKIASEVLATAVSPEALSNLRMSYNLIRQLDESRGLVLNGYRIKKSTVISVSEQIDKTIKLLK